MTDVNAFINMIQQSKIRFSVLNADCKVAVADFTVNEGISSCFTMDLTLVSEDKIKKPEEMLEKEGLLTLPGGPGERYFHGVISHFILMGQNGRFYTYRANVVPSLWFLTLNKDCRIFQSMTVPDIVKEILKDNKIETDKYEFRLLEEAKFKKRRYCVQYRETDLGFISRLLEEEGIYYFFEHQKDKHLLVFSNSTVGYRPIEGIATIKYKSGGGMVASEESISKFMQLRSVRPGLISQTAYNFKTPSAYQESEARGETNEKYEIYDFPHNYGNTDDGKRLAKIRLEEHKMMEQTISGVSNSSRLSPGFTFKLYGHPFSSLDKEYVVVSAAHEGTQAHVLGEQTGIGGDYTYNNAFTVIPSSVTLRPGTAIPKPIIFGLQSATVVGPENEEIYVDEYGRVKVQFHWDRLGKKDEKSSCWLRCGQTWGGGGWGTMFIPRIGDEVLVAFMEGDPDWPIIVGSVYNGANPPLYDLPANKTRSTIKTKSYPNSNGYNELRFEDRAGSEEIYLQGEKDWNILIKNDKGQTIGHDETLSVGNNRTKSVGVNQSETIGANKTISVGGNHSESIGANMTLTVGANKFDTTAINVAETIGAAKELTIGGLYQISVGGVMNETVAGAKTEEVGAAKAVVVANNMTEYVKGNRKSTVDGDLNEKVEKKHTEEANEYTLEAKSKITFKVGTSTIVMDAGSITIMANKVYSN